MPSLPTIPALPLRLSDLPGLGPKTQLMLAQIGIDTVPQFMATDPFDLYARLKSSVPGISLNALYAMMGAQENRHWQDIKNERRLEILLRLDQMGLAPTVRRAPRAIALKR